MAVSMTGANRTVGTKRSGVVRTTCAGAASGTRSVGARPPCSGELGIIDSM